MRRIALYSDVHANTDALAAVDNDITAEGLTERYCLGDLVGLGPRPDEAVDLVRRTGDTVIQGNYDRAIGAHLCSPGSEFPTAQEALDGAESYAFTVSNTGREAADYLFALPRGLTIDVEGIQITLCHGTPRVVSGVMPVDTAPAHLVSLVREAGTDVVCGGHTHVPFHRSIPTESGVVHWVNAGSVGRPRDGDSRAAWVELAVGRDTEVVGQTPADTACRRIGDSDVWLGVVIHRVTYDVDAVVRDMARQGLPATLAAGLRLGAEEHDLLAGTVLNRPESVSMAPGSGLVGVASQAGLPAPSLPCGHVRETCTCLYDDRTAAYEALSRLYRGDIAEVSAAVRSLRVAMRGCRVNRHVDEAAILAAFEGADRALRTNADRVAFEEERERLIGVRAGFDPFVNVLSPEEITYLSGDVDRHAEALEAAYREGSFTVPQTASGVRPTGHISTELSFMAHSLRGAAAGDSRALERAREFFAQHLAEWAVLFAVVVGQQAREPVMRYAGLALDKFLTCEGPLFRERVADYGDVATLHR
jgi:predicted phosphodiesterase